MPKNPVYLSVEVDLLVQASPYFVIGKTYSDGASLLFNMGGGSAIRFNAEAMKVLSKCQTPRSVSQLREEYDSDSMELLINAQVIVKCEQIWDWHAIGRVEIEIGTYCNWSCEFCPNRENAKPRKSMAMDLFEMIIAKAARHSSIQAVTFHSYNEPTVDKDFETRIELLAKSRLKLDLYTNGSGLTKTKLQMLHDKGVLRTIVFNIPTVDENRFEQITGVRTYRQSMQNIDDALNMGFNIQFAIISTGDEESERNLEQIRNRFGGRFKQEITPWPTTDRAGLLTNKYAQMIDITNSYLHGCYLPLFQLNVGVDGNCFICCEDFYQKETFGHIRDGEIDEILNSERARTMRRHIFGGACAPKDFICRRCKEMKRFSQYPRSFRPSEQMAESVGAYPSTI